jgi:hypothetical protein
MRAPARVVKPQGAESSSANASATSARSATERPYQPTVSSVVEISLIPSVLTAFQVGFIA